MKEISMFRIGVSVVLALTALCKCAVAAHPADESYRIAETERLDLIARQLDLNYRMIWQAGYGPRYPDPFEPWPRVPGDIWGYPSPRPIEHPVGHQSAQTGPNRWIYRPIYAAEMAANARVARNRGTASQRGGNAIRPAPRPAPSDLADPAPAAREYPAAHGPRQF